jgi:hypothetical protein
LDHMNEDEPKSFSLSYGQWWLLCSSRYQSLYSQLELTPGSGWALTICVGIAFIITTLLSSFWILNLGNYNTKIPPMKSLHVVQMQTTEYQLWQRDLIYSTTCGQNCIFDTFKRVIKENAVLSDRSMLTPDEKFIITTRVYGVLRVYSYPKL